MKYKEAREDIAKIREDLGNLRVRYCKKCKHDTLHEVYRLLNFISFGFDATKPPPITSRSLCLSCGTKWNCHEETICEEVNKCQSKG